MSIRSMVVALSPIGRPPRVRCDGAPPDLRAFDRLGRHPDPVHGRPTDDQTHAHTRDPPSRSLMSRRTPAILATVTTLALALSACQGAPTAPALTGPTEIVTAALTATEAAKSVHVDVTLDGTLSVAVPGLGAATPVNLTGSTANADVDFTKPALKATFAIPAMLG